MMNENDLDAAVRSERLIEVRRRIFRQLVESMVYEKIIHPELGPELGSDGTRTVFRLHGLDGDGCRVTYLCRGRQAWGFDRIRLSADPVMRIKDGEACEAESLSQ